MLRWPYRHVKIMITYSCVVYSDRTRFKGKNPTFPRALHANHLISRKKNSIA